MIETEYNGRTLRLNENDETWSCHSMEMKAKTLRALKAKLDKHDAVARQVSVPVLYLKRFRDSAPPLHASIVMLAKPKDWDSEYRGSGEGRANYPTVWLNVVEGNQVERKKARITECIEPTAENLALFERAQGLFRDAHGLKKMAEGIIENIPRMTLDSLKSDVTEDDSED